jgi:multidrug efflux pump subunit AcrA (membrane-fusion protein)
MRLPARFSAVAGALGAAALVILLTTGPEVHAQMPGGPPSVGVVKAQNTPITETSEFVGRIQSIDRVALTARVTAFLDERRSRPPSNNRKPPSPTPAPGLPTPASSWRVRSRC